MRPLKDLCASITDGEHGTINDDSSGKYHLLSNKNLLNNSVVISIDDRKINEETFKKINKRVRLQPHSILMSTVGTVGKISIVSEENLNYVFQRSVAVINVNPNLLDPYYLMALLESAPYQKFLKDNATGSIQKCLFISTIENIPIASIPITKQQEIGSKFKHINSLIKKNNEIINELTNKIKDIYSFYFENSKLSNCDKNYFDSFSGCYLPLGWKYENLGKYIDGITTGLNPRANFVLNNGGKIPYVTIKNIEDNGINLKKCDYIDMDAFNKIQNRSKLKNGDILYTSLSPAGLTYFLLSWKNEFQINESVFCIKTNDCKLNKYYLYTALNTNSFKKYENNFVNGSNQKSIKQAQILDLKILIPSKELIDKFSNKVQSLYLEIDKLQRQNTILSSYKHEILNFLVKKLV